MGSATSHAAGAVTAGAAVAPPSLRVCAAVDEALPLCLSTAQRVLHLKGFGSGRLAPESAAHDQALVKLVLEELGPGGVIVWDGDEFCETAFTRILDKLLSMHKVDAVAFYYRGLRQGFESSWRPRLGAHAGEMHLVLLEDPLEGLGSDAAWVQLGLEALRLTGAQRVLALGGGGVAALEVLAGTLDEALCRVQWTVCQLPRAPAATSGGAAGLAGPPDYGSLYERCRKEAWPNVRLCRPPWDSAQAGDGGGEER